MFGRVQTIIGCLKPAAGPGVYECPYSYKRLLNEQVIRFLVRSGHFAVSRCKLTGTAFS